MRLDAPIRLCYSSPIWLHVEVNQVDFHLKKFLTTLCIFSRRMKTLLSIKHYLYPWIFIVMVMTSLYGKISEISKSHGLPHFVPNNSDKTKISWYKDIMKQKHITRLTVFSYWFKHCYEISSYLNPTSKTIDRKALVTFGKTTRKKS